MLLSREMSNLRRKGPLEAKRTFSCNDRVRTYFRDNIRLAAWPNKDPIQCLVRGFAKLKQFQKNEISMELDFFEFVSLCKASKSFKKKNAFARTLQKNQDLLML